MKTSLVAKIFSFNLWAFLTFFSLLPASAYGARSPEDIFRAVVKVHSQIPPEAQTASSLGTQREGSGVVIDANGLVLTIGYLILEAEKVEVTGPSGKAVKTKFVGYDHNTGFGLVRAGESLGVTPMELGDSATVGERDQVLVASYGGSDTVQPAFVVSRREFAGNWEYLLENAIFTAPPHGRFGGAALIGPRGNLLGIGSLIVQDALPAPELIPGNMFVPIDLLKPILKDMTTRGRSSEPPRPWLGISSQEFHGRLIVARVSPEGPGDAAGIKPGDLILGVGGVPVRGLADFYRKVWSKGTAGVTVSLNVLQGLQVRELAVRSVDRYRFLKLAPMP